MSENSERPAEITKTYRPAPDQGGFAQELADLDDRLLGLILRRCRVLAERATARRRGGKTAVDADLEKMLWKVWSGNRAAKSGVSPTVLRQIFGLLNTLAYREAEPKSDSRRDFILSPAPGAVDIELSGPADMFQTRVLAMLAAAHGAPCLLKGAVRNDPMIELVKAMNAAGASLSWEDDRVVNAPAGGFAETGPLTFDNKNIFVGADPLNLAMIIGLALPGAGRLKLLGSAELAGLDLTPLTAMLPLMGARLTRVNPNVSGLPARLETCGMMAADIKLTADFPVTFALGLMAAATTYPEGLAVSWAPGWPGAGQVRRLAAVLKSVGLRAKVSAERIEITPGRPHYGESLTPDLDIRLCAGILALPRLRGGRARILGSLDGGNGLIAALEEFLAATGTVLAVDAAGVSATVRPWPQTPVFTPPAEFLPLAVALALGSPAGAVLVLPDGPDLDAALDLASAFGSRTEVEDGSGDSKRLTIGPGLRQAAANAVYTAPSPDWGLACALASAVHPGLTLANPGILTIVWPGFWNIYNALPAIQLPEPAPETPETADDGKSRKRRIRV